MVAKTSKKPVSEKKSNLTAKVYDLKGKELEEITLSEKVFNVEVSKNLVAQYVRVFLSIQRQGTASTKTRSEVAGSTRKIYRQKGTGRARHGAKKGMSVGGGVIHAPKPRDFSLKINDKQKDKVLLGMLSQKLQNNEIIFVKDLAKIEPKTKNFASLLKSLNVNIDKNNLIINDLANFKNIALSSRNIKNINRTDAKSLNAFNLLKTNKIIFELSALEVLENRFK